jgi:uncharacterized surface protein with fasciclin (FAS1) repeats
MKTRIASLKLITLPCLLIAMTASVACTSTTVEAPAPAAVTVVAPMASVSASSMGNIANVAASAGQFGTLLAAVSAADLNATLMGPGPLTVFAPTDAAFDKLPTGTVQKLLKPENRDALRQLITYHVVSARVSSGELMGKTMSTRTAAGSDVTINGTDGVMINNSARVIQADIMASNGIVHAIDTVLMPPNMMALR